MDTILMLSVSIDEEIFVPVSGPALTARPLFVLGLVLLAAAALALCLCAVGFFVWKRKLRVCPLPYRAVRRGALALFVIAAAAFAFQFLYELFTHALGGAGQYFCAAIGADAGFLSVGIVQAAVYGVLAGGAARLYRRRRRLPAAPLAPVPFDVWIAAAGAAVALAAWGIFQAFRMEAVWRLWLIALAFSVPLSLLVWLARGAVTGTRAPLWTAGPSALYLSAAALWAYLPYVCNFAGALERSLFFGIAAFAAGLYLFLQGGDVLYRFVVYVRARKEVALLLDGTPRGALPPEVFDALRGADVRFALRIRSARYADAEDCIRAVQRQEAREGGREAR